MTGPREFLEIFQQHVTRPGSEKLLDWLDNKTDFFRSGVHPVPRCLRGRAVYAQPERLPRAARQLFHRGRSEESFAICALLHDLCKANYYKPGTRNVKNEATGQWEKVPSYSVEDCSPTATAKRASSSSSGS